MPGKVPERWQEYSPYKAPVKCTRFIAFKVPLEQSICHRLPKEKWLRPKDLLELLDKDNYKLGLIVDLTNTNRYYKREEVESHDIQYVKIKTEGHLVPSKEVQDKFAGIVDGFLESNIDNDLLIGVHCTHGLNRTGYMVCRYMIDRMKFDPQEAINAFNEARGHDIERENYLIDLLNSNKNPEERVVIENASDGEIIDDEDEDDDDDDSDLDESETSVKSNPENQPAASPLIPDKVTPLPPIDAPNFGQPTNSQANFQNDFRGRGFQRRMHGNRGFQNNFNRGGGGGFNQNFENRRGFRSRNRGSGGGGGGGGGRNFRGNFHGGWKDQKPSFYNYDDDDLDDDTEVIITATERGTIIREERSISEHRRKLAEFQGRGRGVQQPRNTSLRRAHEEVDSYRAARPGRDRLGHSRFDDDWGLDDEPRKKQWKADDAFTEHDSYHMDSWKGRGPFEAEGLAKGRGAFESKGRGSVEHTAAGRGRGMQYPQSSDWGYKGRGYHDDVPPNRSRYYDDDDDDDGVGTRDSYLKKYSKGFGSSQRSRRSWSPDGPKGYCGVGETRFRGQGQAGFRGPVEDRGGYTGHGRGRDKSPPEVDREESPLGYRSRTREPGYGDIEQGLSYPGERSGRFKDTPEFSRFREEGSSDFFGKKSRSAFHDDGPTGFRKNMGPAGFRDESPAGFGSERVVGGKKAGSYNDGFRKQKYQARAVGQRDSFTGDSFHDADNDAGMATTRRRRMTPPAQYRDPEPDDNEDSPPFCDDSPPFVGSGEGFGACDTSFRGQGRDDCFRARGRGFSRGAF